MAKKKLDIRLNAEYMDNAALTALANREKAVRNREKYIWAVPKFCSQNIYENCNKEKEVKEKDKFSLRENGNSEIDQTLHKINSDRKQLDSHRPRQNVRERYHKQIAESRKYEAAGSHEDRQQNMSVEYLDSGKGTERESMKSMPETNRWNKLVSSMQNVSGENQEFASGMVSAKNTHSGQFYQQMKKAPHPHSSQMLDERKPWGDLHHTQNFLKRKQKVTFGSTGSIGNENQQRRRIRREFKSPEKNNSPKQYSSEEKCISEDSTKSLLCVKIWKNDDSRDFITYLSDLSRIKQKYPKLSEVIPDVHSEEKEVKYCFDAVKAIMKYLFEPPYSFDAKLENRLAIEILAASRSWEIRDFRSNFQKHFLQNVLSQNNVKELYLLAQHFEENEISDACRNFAKDDAVVNLKMPKYGQKTCFVKIDFYHESLQFTIQLAEAAATDFFIDSLPTDISNEITFEAISGSYAIEGFEITLKDDLKADTLPALEISYDAINNDENISVHEQKRKPQRSKIVIYLKRKLIVKPNQKGKITVETRIKPCSCFVVESENVIEEHSKGKFSLSVTSTRKNKFNEKRFLVGKLLYNYL